MAKGRIQRIQDSIHGLMEFHGRETILVDLLRTPELQRLRRIRQTGLANLVFPGAEHSRLVHSLGAAHLALRFARHLEDVTKERLVDALRPKDSAARDLAVAALCHDLGHGPFSHAWEREIAGEEYDREPWIRALALDDDRELLVRAKWHELVGQGLLAWPDGTLHKLLESHETGFSRRVRYLLRGNYYLPYLPRLISSDVDVDRADFLLRDAHQCGVAYGRYDIGWLLSTCVVGRLANGLVVGFEKRKSVRIVEQFLIARRALYETVYHHKTVRSIDGMAGLFLKRLREVVTAGARLRVAEFVQPLVRMISGEVLHPHELLSLDDHAVWVLLENVASDADVDLTARDLANRILARDLFKLVPCHTERVAEFLQREDGYARIYHAIQRFCPGEAEYYLAVDRVRFEMFADHDQEKAYFVDDDETATPVREHDEFRLQPQKPEAMVRLFTVRGAVEEVMKLIGT